MPMSQAELRDAFRHLDYKESPYTSEPWKQNIAALREFVINRKLDDLLLIPTLVKTMITGPCEYIEDEYGQLPSYITNKLFDSGFGNPPMLSHGMTSASYSHQAFHLYQWMQMTGKRPDQIKSIVEFGGGFGAMAVVARLLGFTGVYTIYDIPELSLIQSYYLSNVGCEVNIVPMNEWKQMSPHKGADLLIGAYSLSEVPYQLRESFFNTIDPNGALIVTSFVWEGESLMDYWREFCNNRPRYKWYFREHYHSWLSGHYYIVGEK